MLLVLILSPFLPCFEERSSPVLKQFCYPWAAWGLNSALVSGQQQGVKAGGGLVSAKTGGGLLVGEKRRRCCPLIVFMVTHEGWRSLLRSPSSTHPCHGHQTMSPSAKATGVLNTSRDADPTTALSSLFQCLNHSQERNFPDLQPKPPLAQSEAISSCPTT